MADVFADALLALTAADESAGTMVKAVPVEQGGFRAARVHAELGWRGAVASDFTTVCDQVDQRFTAARDAVQAFESALGTLTDALKAAQPVLSHAGAAGGGAGHGAGQGAGHGGGGGKSPQLKQAQERVDKAAEECVAVCKAAFQRLQAASPDVLDAAGLLARVKASSSSISKLMSAEGLVMMAYGGASGAGSIPGQGSIHGQGKVNVAALGARITAELPKATVQQAALQGLRAQQGHGQLSMFQDWAAYSLTGSGQKPGGSSWIEDLFGGTAAAGGLVALFGGALPIFWSVAQAAAAGAATGTAVSITSTELFWVGVVFGTAGLAIGIIGAAGLGVYEAYKHWHGLVHGLDTARHFGAHVLDDAGLGGVGHFIAHDIF